MSRFVRMNPKRVVLVIAVVAVTAIALTTWRSIKRRHQEETLEPDNLDEVAMRHLAKLGNGYVVWERFRDDTWQIWTKRLVGGIEKRLVPEEHGRGHFCPKFSPQGGRLSYLSYEANKTAYQSNPGRTGDLWVMNLDRRKERRLIGKARSYGEDRAVTWINDDVLCYINADGETIELDLKSNRSRKIINAHEAAFGLSLIHI